MYEWTRKVFGVDVSERDGSNEMDLQEKWGVSCLTAGSGAMDFRSLVDDAEDDKDRENELCIRSFSVTIGASICSVKLFSLGLSPKFFFFE